MHALTSFVVLFASFGPQAELPLPVEQPVSPPQSHSFYWGDVDGDGLDDALAVDLDGRASLLLNRGDGSFEDITLAAGLMELEGVTLAAFADFDGDSRVDLFTGGVGGRDRLYRNQVGVVFERKASGLDHSDLDLAARVLDYDRDGQLDLQVETDAGERLYRNVGNAQFEQVELQLAVSDRSIVSLGAIDVLDPAAAPSVVRARRLRASGRPASNRAGATQPPNGPEPSELEPATGGPLAVAAPVCVTSMDDIATLNCIQASSTPTLGMLYPLSTAFNVDTSGRVGINTTSPAHRLHVVDTDTAVFGQGGLYGVRGDANQGGGSGFRYGGYFTASGGANNVGAYGAGGIGAYGAGTSTGVFGITYSGSGRGVDARAESTTGSTIGVYGQAASTAGTAVLGSATATTGTGIGVRGTTASTGGSGVRGEGLVTGVRGDANGTGGSGDRFGGHFTASGGSNNVGVYSFSDTGVQGVGNSTGVLGTTSASTGIAVRGSASSASGANVGVQGETASTVGTAVKGTATSSTGTAIGLHGTTSADNGIGVRGEVTSASATGFAYGVEGIAPFRGVWGLATNAVSSSSIGVTGITSSSTGTGVLGSSTGPTGAYGVRGLGRTGVDGRHVGSTGVEPGVRGESPSSSVGAVGVLGVLTAPTAFGSPVGVDSAGVKGENPEVGPNGSGVWGHHAGTGTGVTGTSANLAASGFGGVGGRFTGGTGLIAIAGNTQAPANLLNASGAALVGDATELGGSAAHTGVRGWGRVVGVFGELPFWGNLDGGGIGVLGSVQSASADGVVGRVTGTTGTGSGVYGSTSTGQAGVAAIWGASNSTTSNDTIGVRGDCVNSSSVGRGTGGQFRGGQYGVRGTADQTGVGILRIGGEFVGENGSGVHYGVIAEGNRGATGFAGYGIYASSDNYAGYFSGAVHVNGAFSANTKAFKIDHPLDPQNKYLWHSCVESADMKNIYDGTAVLDAGGFAWIDLPEWFEALNGEFRYQLTPIGAPALVFVASEIADNRFRVGGPPGIKVSWQVTGIRKDPSAVAHRVPSEQDKPERERGLYLDPQAHGMPRELGLEYATHLAPLEAQRAEMDAARQKIDAKRQRQDQAELARSERERRLFDEHLSAQERTDDQQSEKRDH